MKRRWFFLGKKRGQQTVGNPGAPIPHTLVPQSRGITRLIKIITARSCEEAVRQMNIFAESVTVESVGLRTFTPSESIHQLEERMNVGKPLWIGMLPYLHSLTQPIFTPDIPLTVKVNLIDPSERGLDVLERRANAFARVQEVIENNLRVNPIEHSFFIFQSLLADKGDFSVNIFGNLTLKTRVVMAETGSELVSDLNEFACSHQVRQVDIRREKNGSWLGVQGYLAEQKR